MKIIFLTFLVILIPNFLSAQDFTSKDSIMIEVVKVKNAPKLFYAQQNVKIKQDGVTKIMIKTKIASEAKKVIDINPFCLLDTVNKIRYKLLEFVAYKPVSIGFSTYGAKELMKTEFLRKNGKKYPDFPTYDPSIKDTFYEYRFDGYTNLVSKINFGMKKKPKLSEIYYAPIKMHSFTGDIFFAIQKFAQKPFFQLYYGNEKVADVDIQLE